MAVKIIRARVEDVNAIAALFDSYRRFYGEESNLEGAAQFLVERLTRQQSVVFFATEGSGSRPNALGFVQLYPSFSSVQMKSIWILNDIFVAKVARRLGVGHLLMNAALSLAQSSGAARLVLSTAKDNVAARSLYFSLGYVLDDAFDHLKLSITSAKSPS
jgi:ribosomal protein S18 acetylase RimI-like enzyme